MMWAQCSRNVPCVGYVNLLLELSLDFCWPFHAWGELSGWLTVRINLHDNVRAAVQMPIRRSRIHPSRIWCLLRSPFGCATCEANWILLLCFWSWPVSVLVLGTLGRDSGADECQMLPVTGPGWPVWSYKAIHGLWIPLLDLIVHGKDQVAHQGWLSPTPGTGAGQQKSQRILRSAPTCFHLPDPC